MEKMKDVIQRFLSSESNLFIYSLSFGLLLSLAPSLIIFATMFRWGNFLDINVIFEFLNEMHLSMELQEQLSNLLYEFMAKDNGIVPAFTTLCVSFWLASRSINSFLWISARMEKVSVVKFAIRIQSIFIFIVIVASVIGLIIIMTICNHFFNPSQLPFLGALVMTPLFMLMYRSLSFRKRSISFGLVGALFTTTGMILLFYLSFILVNQMLAYNKLYGSLASLVFLLLVIYIISCIIYIGFLLNLVYEETYGNEDLLPLKHKKYYETCNYIYHYCHNIGVKLLEHFRRK